MLRSIVQDEIERDRSNNIRGDERSEKWKDSCAMTRPQNNKQRYVAKKAGRPEEKIEARQMHLYSSAWAAVEHRCLWVFYVKWSNERIS
jgi:hypothetical protein